MLSYRHLLVITITNQKSICVFPFETILIMVSFFFESYEYQEIQIKNPFDPILSFHFLYLKINNYLLKRDILAKDFQNDSYNKNILMVRKNKNDKNLLATFKKMF
jgi:hypothetical protein